MLNNTQQEPGFSFAISNEMVWFTFLLCLIRMVGPATEWNLFFRSQTQPLHDMCLAAVENKALHSVFKGLICGGDGLDPHSTELFQSLGLYHLLVVSGSHLIFFENFLEKIFRGRRWPQLVFLVSYAGVCQFNPPVARALVFHVYRRACARWPLFFRDDQMILMSGLWCLIIFPEWVLSFSLILSWIASLSLNLSRRALVAHLAVLVYLGPLLGSVEFSAWFNNVLAGPLFSIFLFPFSFLCFLVPGLGPLGNTVWDYCLQGMTWLPKISHVTDWRALNPIFCWAYVFVLHLLHRRRRS